MSDLLTTQEAADKLGWSYDYTRKMLSQYEPVKIIGKNKLWSAKQVESLRETK